MGRIEGFHGNSAMSQGERDALLALIGKNDRVLEIGTLDGATVAYWASKRSEAYFLSVDAFKAATGTGAGKIDLWLKNHRPNQSLFVGTVQDVERVFQLGFFDVVVVDAGHGYDDCRRDLVSASVLVKAAGKLLVHDYGRAHLPHLAGVTKAVDEFCISSPWAKLQKPHCTAVLMRSSE